MHVFMAVSQLRAARPEHGAHSELARSKLVCFGCAVVIHLHRSHGTHCTRLSWHVLMSSYLACAFGCLPFDSSFQGQPSSVSGTVSADTGYVLKGTPYSRSTVTVVPTVYTLLDEPERAGVIPKWNAELRGAQYTPQTMSATGSDMSKAGFGTTLAIESFGATLSLSITLRQSWPVTVSQLLAILSGAWTIGKMIVAVAQQLCYSSKNQNEQEVPLSPYVALPSNP